MRLLLLLSFGGSLRKWREQGILRREMELYVKYLETAEAERLVILSYDPDDAGMLELAVPDPALRSRVDLIVPRKRATSVLRRLAYSLGGQVLREARARGVTVVKTNQISGSWTALMLRLFGMPFLARCGYILSRRHWKNRRYLAAASSLVLEILLFNLAFSVSVTTPGAASTVGRLVLDKSKIFVAPTYVNTELFSPKDPVEPREADVVFVGRLEPQKNVAALIEACALAGATLRIVGTGSLRNEVRSAIAACPVPVVLSEKLDNDEIAALYNRCRLFVLPSLHEGLPKVLIEAMSSGMVCVGTPVPGTTDLIIDGCTGILCSGTDAGGIADGIRRGLSLTNAGEMGKRARQYVLDYHSLSSYFAREASAIRRLPARG
jgi:glycosyltransferase involved in cell wall biosynthesis